MGRRGWTCLTLLTGLCASAPAARSSPGDPPEENGWALLQVEIDNQYPTKDLPSVGAAIDALPERIATLPSNGTVSQLIVDEYGFGRRDLPQLYDRVVAAITVANGLASADEVKPGSLKVPALPPWGFAVSAPAAFQDMTHGEPSQRPQLSGGALFAPEVAIKPARTVYHVRVPRSQLGLPPYKALLEDPNTVLAAWSFDIRFARAAAVSPPTDLLTAADASALTALLAGGQRPQRVFVLDDGWPGEAAWRESRATLSQLCARVRSHYGFAKGPDLSAQGTFPPSSLGAASHAARIEQSIAALRLLSSRVEVVYVPLTRDQGASDVLREIVTLGLAVTLAEADLRTIPPPLARSRAATILGDVQGHVDPILARLSDAPKTGGASIDAALVAGVFAIASKPAELDQVGFFVNESWTTLDTLVKISSPDRAVIVAAVGNEPGRVVDHTPLVAFAGRSALERQIVAVLTLNAAGKLGCDSSTLGFEDEEFGAVAFRGDVGSECASSFATPRVAWFLAARETLGTASIKNGPLWINSVRKRLKDLRLAGKLPPDSIHFDPLSYVQAP